MPEPQDATEAMEQQNTRRWLVLTNSMEAAISRAAALSVSLVLGAQPQPPLPLRVDCESGRDRHLAGSDAAGWDNGSERDEGHRAQRELSGCHEEYVA